MEATKQCFLDLPWWDDAKAADRAWRVVVRALGGRCDQLWLRFGGLEGLEGNLTPAQYQRLAELLGPYYGQPDPYVRPPRPPEEEAQWGELLSGLKEMFEERGFREAPAPSWQPPPCTCAVVPVSGELIALLTELPDADLLERLADHWHFRSDGRDLIATGDGVHSVGLQLTAEEVDLVGEALAAGGLDRGMLVVEP